MRIAAYMPTAILLLLPVCALAQGGICKWTDSDGVVHFAEHCPDESDAQEVAIEPPPSRERIEEAQRRSEAMVRGSEVRRGVRHSEQAEERQARSDRERSAEQDRSACVDAMVDLHNLREGEAMYRDEDGRLHDQFSIHSRTYAGERHYIEDAEHKALIQQKQRVVDSDCDQARDEIIARISMLARRSDSRSCNLLYENVLQDRKYERSMPIRQLQATEQAVLENCN